MRRVNTTQVQDFFIRLFIDYTVWVILVVIFVFGVFFIPAFAKSRNFLIIATQAVPLGMMVFGLSLVLMGNNFDLSLESTYAIAPGIGILFATQWFKGIAFGGLLAIAITLLIGLGVGTFNGLISKKLNLNPFLTTLAMMLFLRGLTLYLVPEGLYNVPKSYAFLGKTVVFGRLLPLRLPFFIAVFIFLYFLLNKRPFGKRLLGIGSNEFAAFIAGVEVQKIQIYSFMLAGLLASLGGMISVGRQSAVINSMGEGTILLAFAACALGGISLSGGVGSIFGALGGILILQMISNILTLSEINPFLMKATYGLVLLLAILLDNLKNNVREWLTKIRLPKSEEISGKGEYTVT